MFDVLMRSTLAMLCLRYPDKKTGDISIVFRADVPDLAPAPEETPESKAGARWPLPPDVKYRASVRLGAGSWGASTVHSSPEAALAALHDACLSELKAGESLRTAVAAQASRTSDLAKQVHSAGAQPADRVDALIDRTLAATNYDNQQK